MDLFGHDNGERLPYDFGAVLHNDVWTDAESDRLMSELTTSLAWEQITLRMFGRLVPQPRLTAWYGDPDRRYTYSGIHLSPLPWTPLLSEIRGVCCQLAGANFNSVLANLYRSGDDGVTWHADDERELGDQPVIASVSLGATRRFEMRHRQTKEVVRIDLTSGSVLVMSGLSQSKWLHQIPKSKRAIGPRINLTFRTIHG